MLFYHTKHVINEQMKANVEDEEDAEGDDDI
jgi:hypothetical protein